MNYDELPIEQRDDMRLEFDLNYGVFIESLMEKSKKGERK